MLAELPPIDSISLPYQWLGRLRSVLSDLVAVASPGGMDNGQREVLAAALADAAAWRDPADAACTACAADPAGECRNHAADAALVASYHYLADELGIEVPR